MKWVVIVQPNVLSDSDQVKIWVAERLAIEIQDRLEGEVDSVKVEAVD